jgi:hypothetical protein
MHWDDGAGTLQSGESAIHHRGPLLACGLGARELGLPLGVKGIESPQHLLEGGLHRGIHDATRSL